MIFLNDPFVNDYKKIKIMNTKKSCNICGTFMFSFSKPYQN